MRGVKNIVAAANRTEPNRPVAATIKPVRSFVRFLAVIARAALLINQGGGDGGSDTHQADIN